MLEQEIKKEMKNRGFNPVDVYKPLKINRVNFYKAIKTSNLKNKSLEKILKFLDLKLTIILEKYVKKRKI